MGDEEREKYSCTRKIPEHSCRGESASSCPPNFACVRVFRPLFKFIAHRNGRDLSQSFQNDYGDNLKRQEAVLIYTWWLL